MPSFSSSLLKTLNNGDKVTGTVMAIGSTEIQVDLGTKHTAYIPVEDLTSDPSVKVEDVVQVGDEIETDRRPWSATATAWSS